MGSDGCQVQVRRRAELFQSTLPVWGATQNPASGQMCAPHFNPRSPCGERRSVCVPDWLNSSHFNPRSPCGERPGRERAGGQGRGISIHAPRVGSDHRRARAADTISYFNPRSPCGERRHPLHLGQLARLISIHAPRVGSDRRVITVFTWFLPFQSTLPVWGATAKKELLDILYLISIHAPRVGSDPTPAPT